MKRQLMLIEADTTEQVWVTQQLATRFRSLVVHTAVDMNAARSHIVTHGCDIIIVNLRLPRGGSDADVMQELLEFATGIPVIALTWLDAADELLLDVLATGVQHVLYQEDVRKDFTKLGMAIVDVLRDIATRDRWKDDIRERMLVVQQKVWGVDGRLVEVESALKQLTTGIGNMTEAVEKRGGLEDRLQVLERHRDVAVRLGIAILSAAGAVALSILGTLISRWH